MKSIPFSSLLFIFLIVVSCHKKKNTPSEIRHYSTLYDKALNFYDHESWDSSFYYLNEVKKEALLAKDTLLAGKALTFMALCAYYRRDFFGSNELNIEALTYFNENDSLYKESIFNSLAISSNNLNNYEEAKYWYHKALKYSKDSTKLLIIKNNIAINLLRLNKTNAAIQILTDLKQKTDTIKNQKRKVRILDNLAYAKWKQNPTYNAEQELLNALAIRDRLNDLWGQNASHAHLSDYYENINPEKALFHAQKMYKVAQQLNSPDDKLEALKRLIKFDKPAELKAHYNAYIQLNDSLQTARSQAKNQFALIRYDAEKNRTDNLELKLKISEEEFKAERARLWSILILGLFTLLIILGFFWYKNYKRKAEERQIKKIEETESRISKTVHDSVANSIHRLMSELKHTPERLTTEGLLNRLEKVYHQARDVSRETQAIHLKEGFTEELMDLIYSYKNEHRKILTNPMNEDFWKKIKDPKKLVCYKVLQEIMTNMEKHSNAQLVEITILRKRKRLYIEYTDDGVGFDFKETKHKNGLMNTENRIKDIQGNISFEQNKPRGTQINISFPV